MTITLVDTQNSINNQKNKAIIEYAQLLMEMFLNFKNSIET